MVRNTNITNLPPNLNKKLLSVSMAMHVSATNSHAQFK